jgi:hypothetical protein
LFCCTISYEKNHRGYVEAMTSIRILPKSRIAPILLISNEIIALSWIIWLLNVSIKNRKGEMSLFFGDLRFNNQFWKSTRRTKNKGVYTMTRFNIVGNRTSAVPTSDEVKRWVQRDISTWHINIVVLITFVRYRISN